MPPEGLPLVVTSGLGIGVFAGVVSGICYVFFQGFRSSGTRPKKYAIITSSQCCVCGVHFVPLLKPDQTTSATACKSLTPSTSIRSANPLKEVRRRVTCSECHGRACRGGSCSLYLRYESAWLCTQCRKPVSWFRGVLAGWPGKGFTVRMSKQPATNLLEPKSLNNEKNEEKEIVRDFIERLVGAMLEANLDDTSVNRLYKDSEYDAMFDRYHGDISSALTELGSALHISIANLPITGQTPCTAHATLKTIIKRVLRDASNLTILKEPQDETEVPEQPVNQTYEDLLATAILNKVIDNYQHDVRRSSSSSSSAAYNKKPEKPPKQKKTKYTAPSIPIIHKVDDVIFKPQEMDTASLSSVEDWCRSESSYGSKRIDPVSLTIKHSIEEISSTSEDDMTQQYVHSNNVSRSSSFRNDSMNSSMDREDWQDNWLFSCKGKGSPKPVPVPMLVPSPSTEFRALIGDRDADDTTDLSETGSDIDDSDTVSSIKNILVDSRTVIGGKNLLENINPQLLEPQGSSDDDLDQDLNSVNDEIFRIKDEISIADVHVNSEVIINGNYNGTLNNGYKDADECAKKEKREDKDEVDMVNGEEVSKVDGKDEDGALKKKEEINGKEEMEGLSEAKNDVVIHEIPYEESDSMSSNTEKDAEYTEKYASFPRPIKRKSPVPSPRPSQTNNDEQIKFLNRSTEVEYLSDDEEQPYSIKGSYSEREKEKWRNPIALANNPYSKENLDKRLHSPDQKFGRDYYVRDAKKATGGREKINNDTLEDSRSDFLDTKSLSLTETNGYNDSHIVDPSVFTAVPVIVNSEEEEKEEVKINGVINIENNIRPQSLALSSDSDDIDVKRIYNVETGTLQKYKNTNLPNLVRQTSKSPLGIKQFIMDEMLTPNEQISSETINVKFDENHNNSYENENIEPVMKISSCKNLQSVGVVNVPSYEEKVCAIDLSDEFSLESQNTNSENSIEPIEMRDISKKYLNSLVKSNKKPYIIDNSTSPTPKQNGGFENKMADNVTKSTDNLSLNSPKYDYSAVKTGKTFNLDNNISPTNIQNGGWENKMAENEIKSADSNILNSPKYPNSLPVKSRKTLNLENNTPTYKQNGDGENKMADNEIKSVNKILDSPKYSLPVRSAKTFNLENTSTTYKQNGDEENKMADNEIKSADNKILDSPKYSLPVRSAKTFNLENTSSTYKQNGDEENKMADNEIISADNKILDSPKYPNSLPVRSAKTFNLDNTSSAYKQNGAGENKMVDNEIKTPEHSISSPKYDYSLVKNSKKLFNYDNTSPLKQNDIWGNQMVENDTKITNSNDKEIFSNNQQPYTVNNYTTPPISLHENKINEVDSIIENDTPTNQIHISPFKNIDQNKAVDSGNKMAAIDSPITSKSKSCIDISRIEEPQNTFLSLEYPSLKEKKIVSQFKEDYAKSVPNMQEYDDSFLFEKEDTPLSGKILIIDAEELAKKPSVKDLMKLFDKDESKIKDTPYTKTSHLTTPKVQNKQVHSLTARSIPTQVRLELQDRKEENVIPEKNGLEQEENEEELFKQIPKCRSKIEYFECLKNK